MKTTVRASSPGYRHVEPARLHVMGTIDGGVCFVYTENLHVRPVSFAVYDSCVYVQGSGIYTPIIVVYRLGGATINKDFFESFNDLLEQTAAYKSLLILGDLNIHLDVSTNPHTITFEHTMSEFWLTQLINGSASLVVTCLTSSSHVTLQLTHHHYLTIRSSSLKSIY